MGLFDDVKCDYPLPWPEAQGEWFQSHDTDAQYLEKYLVRENGELWYRSTGRRFEENAQHPIGFQMAEVSAEWVRENVTGEIELNALKSVEGIIQCYSVKFWFRDGLVRDAVFNKSVLNNPHCKCEGWQPDSRKWYADELAFLQNT